MAKKYWGNRLRELEIDLPEPSDPRIRVPNLIQSTRSLAEALDRLERRISQTQPLTRKVRESEKP